MNLDYVDIFYHHRPDPETAVEETMGALDQIVRSGKALYTGISQYKTDQTKRANDILNNLGTPLLIHQPNYHMFDRWIEEGLIDVLKQEGIGCIVFSPLAQGLLTDRYLNGIPSDSRAGKEWTYLKKDRITDEVLKKVRKLNEIAGQRNQSLAQMSLAWVLRKSAVTSALIGASKVSQIEDAAGVLANLDFSEEELNKIENILIKD
jgi:L-glyceraldehyde 3-phosphate reductase